MILTFSLRRMKHEENDTCTRSTLKHLSLVLALTLMFAGLPVEALASVEQEAGSFDAAEYVSDETMGEITEVIPEAETSEILTTDESITDPDTYGENTGVIEINQCFSYHTGRNDGVEKPLISVIIPMSRQMI